MKTLFVGPSKQSTNNVHNPSFKPTFKTIFCWKQVPIKTNSWKNQSWSKSVRATKIKSWVKVCDQKDLDLHQTFSERNARKNLLEKKLKRKSWRHQSVARNLDQTLDLWPNRRKNLVCEVPLLALPCSAVPKFLPSAALKIFLFSTAPKFFPK